MKSTVVVLVILLFVSSLLAIPNVFDYQGKLTDNSGVGIQDTLDMVVRIYDAPTLGAILCADTLEDVPVVKGLFDIDYEVDLTPAELTAGIYMELVIDGNAFNPRIEINTVPYAMLAIHADSIGGYGADDLMPNSLDGAYETGETIYVETGVPIDIRTAYTGPDDGTAMEIRTKDNDSEALYVRNGGAGPAIYCSGDFRIAGGSSFLSNSDFIFELDADSSGISTNDEFIVINDSGAVVFGVDENGDAVILGELDPKAVTFVPQSAAPTGVEGKVYYDDADGKLKWHDGTDWQDFGGGGAGGDYIWDQDSAAQDASFWIEHDGTFGLPPTVFTSIWSESFESGGSTPSGWATEVVVDTDADAAITFEGSGTSPTCSPSDGSYMTKFNSFTCDNGDQMRLYQSTGEDLSHAVGFAGVSLLFDLYYYSSFSYDDTLVVQYSTDGGVTWVDVQVYHPFQSALPNGWHEVDCVLPTSLLPETDVRIAFLFCSDYGYNIYIDNVRLEGSSSAGSGQVFVVDGDVTADNDIEAGSFTLDGITISTWPNFITKFDTINATDHDTVVVTEALEVWGELIADSVQAWGDTIFFDDHIKGHCALFGGGAVPMDTVFFEDFETGGISAWTIVDSSVSGFVWNTTNPGAVVPDPASGITGVFPIVDSDDAGSGNNVWTSLASPVIDLSSYTSAYLSFGNNFDWVASTDYGNIYVWNGTAWVLIKTYSADTYNVEVIDISAYVNAAFQVMFVYNDNSSWAWYWMIDNVLVSAPSGAAPASVEICTGNISADGDIDAGGDIEGGTFTLNGVTIFNWPSGGAGGDLDTIIGTRHDTVVVASDLKVMGELIADSIQAANPDKVVELDGGLSIRDSLWFDGAWRNDWPSGGSGSADFDTINATRHDTVVVSEALKVMGELIADSIQAVGDYIELDDSVIINGRLEVEDDIYVADSLLFDYDAHIWYGYNSTYGYGLYYSPDPSMSTEEHNFMIGDELAVQVYDRGLFTTYIEAETLSSPSVGTLYVEDDFMVNGELIADSIQARADVLYLDDHIDVDGGGTFRGTSTIGTIVLDEGFETSVPPTGWTSSILTGSTNWSQDGSDSHSGSNSASMVTSSYGNSAELYTGTMDISTITNPTLSFWHIQEVFYGDQDSLRVYYRTSSGGAWTLLATYTSSIDTWTQETILLPSPSADYWIRFVAYGEYGYGVFLDDVMVFEPGAPAGDVVINNGNIDADGDLTVDGDATVHGKLTVDGIIDPTGLILDPQATNPMTAGDNGIYVGTDDKLYYYDGTTATDISSGGGSGGVTDLQGAYDGGNTIATSGDTAVSITAATGTALYVNSDDANGIWNDANYWSPTGDVSIGTGNFHTNSGIYQSNSNVVAKVDADNNSNDEFQVWDSDDNIKFRVKENGDVQVLGDLWLSNGIHDGSGFGTAGQVLTTNGSVVSWTDPLVGNTLDEAYDQGGAGAGAQINATDGPVDIRTAYIGPDDGSALEIRTKDSSDAALYVRNGGSGPALYSSGDIHLTSGSVIGTAADVVVQVDVNDNTNDEFIVRNGGGTDVFSVDESGNAFISGNIDMSVGTGILDSDGDAPASSGDVLVYDGTDLDWQAQSGGGVVDFDTINATRHDTVVVSEALKVMGELVVDSIQAVGDIIEMDDSVNVIGGVSLLEDSTYRTDWEAKYVVTVGMDNCDFDNIDDAFAAITANGWTDVRVDLAPGTYILAGPLTVGSNVFLNGSGMNNTIIDGPVNISGEARGIKFQNGLVTITGKAISCEFASNTNVGTINGAIARQCVFYDPDLAATLTLIENGKIEDCDIRMNTTLSGMWEITDNNMMEIVLNIVDGTEIVHFNGNNLIMSSVMIDTGEIYIESNLFKSSAMPAIYVNGGRAEIKANHFMDCNMEAISVFAGIVNVLSNDIIGCAVEGMTEAAVTFGGAFRSGNIIGNHINAGNMFMGTSAGISMAGSGDPTTKGLIKDNVVENYFNGVMVFSMHEGSYMMPIENNVIINNKNHGLLINGGYYLVAHNDLYNNNTVLSGGVDLYETGTMVNVSHNVIDTYSSSLSPVPGALNTGTIPVSGPTGYIWNDPPPVGTSLGQLP